MFPRGKKGPPFPIDLTRDLGEPRALVALVRRAAGLAARSERRGEEAYLAAARRFKVPAARAAPTGETRQ
jgi:hypothetical protein